MAKTTWTVGAACALLMLSLPALADHKGKIIETMNSGGYTYVLLDTADEGKIWLAGPQTQLKVGDTLECRQGMEMGEFESPSLKRKFERIFFVSRFGSKSSRPLAHDPHAGVPGAPKLAGKVEPPKAGSIAKADVTVEELFRNASKYKGKALKIRGRVMKVSPNIMGKTWVHLADGTGSKGSDDLVVTTRSPVLAGTTVVVSGTVKTDVDLGAGYFFPVLIEDARIDTEGGTAL
ncbi:MAG: DNA-binding protein [Acidobacteriota bacterium]|nr:DNA-binding protein [Acidobacteriota bacterium]